MSDDYDYNAQPSICQPRNNLRRAWWRAPAEMKWAKLEALFAHNRACPTCRADLDDQANRLSKAEYPNVDWERVK